MHAILIFKVSVPVDGDLEYHKWSHYAYDQLCTHHAADIYKSVRQIFFFFFFLPYQRLASCLECKWAIPFNKGMYPPMDDSYVLTYPGTKKICLVSLIPRWGLWNHSPITHSSIFISVPCTPYYFVMLYKTTIYNKKHSSWNEKLFLIGKLHTI